MFKVEDGGRSASASPAEEESFMAQTGDTQSSKKILDFWRLV